MVVEVVKAGATGVRIGADVGDVCRSVTVAWLDEFMGSTASVTGWLFVEAPDKTLVDDASNCRLECWMLHLTHDVEALYPGAQVVYWGQQALSTPDASCVQLTAPGCPHAEEVKST